MSIDKAWLRDILCVLLNSKQKKNEFDISPLMLQMHLGFYFEHIDVRLIFVFVLIAHFNDFNVKHN